MRDIRILAFGFLLNCEYHHGAPIILFAFYTDNILDDKPEVKSSADKEEQPVDEIPKRIKKPDNTTQSKGKVGGFGNGGQKSLNYFTIRKKPFS